MPLEWVFWLQFIAVTKNKLFATLYTTNTTFSTWDQLTPAIENGCYGYFFVEICGLRGYS